jgi:hypothetical protein
MTAAGLSWTNWLAVVTLAHGVITAVSAAPSAPGSGGSVLARACVPLAGGLVHVLQHSTVSQVRLGGLLVIMHWLVTRVKATEHVSRDSRVTRKVSVPMVREVQNIIFVHSDTILPWSAALTSSLQCMIVKLANGLDVCNEHVYAIMYDRMIVSALHV